MIVGLFGSLATIWIVESELLMKPLRATILRCGVLCVVMTMVVSGVLGCARIALAGEPMAGPQPPSESRVPFDLFKTWNFDKETAEHTPAGFSSFSVGSAGTPIWVVAQDPSAQTPPNLLKQSAPCSVEDCFQVLLVDVLQYEYLDLIVRVRLAETSGRSNSSAGVVFGARDSQNYYAVTVDPSGKHMEVARVQGGKATTLAHAEIPSKKVAWHLLRVRRNTIISKEYIEVFFDGLQVFSVEDKTFGTGQIGLVTRGPAAAEFDNLTAAPLYSQKPLSGPAAY
jgi:hypothetical protein